MSVALLFESHHSLEFALHRVRPLSLGERFFGRFKARPLNGQDALFGIPQVLARVALVQEPQDALKLWNPEFRLVSSLVAAVKYRFKVSDLAHEGFRLRFPAECNGRTVFRTGIVAQDERIGTNLDGGKANGG